MSSDDEFDLFGGTRTPREDVVRLHALRGVRSGASGRATSGLLGGRLTKMLSGRRIGGGARNATARAMSADGRQRVIVKVGYANHAPRGGGVTGGGGGKLLAHGRYLERDGAGEDGEKGRFYDRAHDIAEDATDRLRAWSEDDPRHFRMVLAPESGARLDDPHGFTRDVMARIERDLGVDLDWLAVDHCNTDNPHTHVILRGVRRDGIELRLPREYISHGLRESAREVATEWLGPRGIEDERLARTREVEARSLTRLDRMIERDLDDRGEVRLQRLGVDRDPAIANALRARARELEKQGLARETKRNVIRFEPGWTERLEARRSVDVRRELVRARLYEPRMGVVRGEVRELGPRGEDPERAALVIDAGYEGRILLNTSMDAVADLQKGSLVALHPEGRRAAIERLAFYSPAEQVRAVADTALDRELDRLAQGQARELPETENVDRALKERAAVHERSGLGARDSAGRFHFREGVRDDLRHAEMDRLDRETADATLKNREDPTRAPDAEWKVREVVELHAGKTAVLERGRGYGLAPVAPGEDLKSGDRVSLRPTRDVGRDIGRDIARETSSLMEVVRGLGRGGGRDR